MKFLHRPNLSFLLKSTAAETDGKCLKHIFAFLPKNAIVFDELRFGDTEVSRPNIMPLSYFGLIV